MRRAITAAVLGLGMLLGATLSGGPAVQAAGSRPSLVAGLPVYLVLGDSVAAGQASAPEPADWLANGYAGQFAGVLVDELDCLPAASDAARDGCRALQTRSLARSAIPGGPGGVTTTSLIAEQLPVAVDLLDGRNGDGNPRNDVEVVTLTVGGNDLFRPVVDACLRAQPPVACASSVQEAFGTFATNYRRILAELRAAAGPDTAIMTMTYYNPLPFCFISEIAPAAGALADVVLEGGRLAGLLDLAVGVNDLIRAISAEHGATVADTYRRLGRTDLVGGVDCLHPNLSGHTVIAGIFAAAFATRPR